VTPICAVAAIVFDAEGRVLLVERGKPPGVGLWTVPGGRLEGAETLAQAVAREVREETGLVVEVGPLACVVERMGDDFHFVILDYLARVIGGTLAAASDARAARFVDDAGLAALPLTDGLVDVLARARATYATWSSTSRSPR
jgi:ADP-ribose pyrophosphatase YjhB (NUDIX family)